MTIIEMLPTDFTDVVDTTDKVEQTDDIKKDEEEYKFEPIEVDPIDIDNTPWLSWPTISPSISIEKKRDLFLIGT